MSDDVPEGSFTLGSLDASDIRSRVTQARRRRHGSLERALIGEQPPSDASPTELVLARCLQGVLTWAAHKGRTADQLAKLRDVLATHPIDRIDPPPTAILPAYAIGAMASQLAALLEMQYPRRTRPPQVAEALRHLRKMNRRDRFEDLMATVRAMAALHDTTSAIPDSHPVSIYRSLNQLAPLRVSQVVLLDQLGSLVEASSLAICTEEPWFVGDVRAQFLRSVLFHGNDPATTFAELRPTLRRSRKRLTAPRSGVSTVDQLDTPLDWWTVENMNDAFGPPLVVDSVDERLLDFGADFDSDPPPLEPKPFQRDIARTLTDNIGVAKAGHAIVAPGGGKTLVNALIAERLIERNAVTIAVPGTRTIHTDQLETTLRRQGIPYRSVSANALAESITTVGVVHIATIHRLYQALLQLRKRPPSEPTCLHLVCDEIHMLLGKKWAKVLDAAINNEIPNLTVRITGTTATGFRTDGVDISDYFGPQLATYSDDQSVEDARTVRVDINVHSFNEGSFEDVAVASLDHGSQLAAAIRAMDSVDRSRGPNEVGQYLFFANSTAEADAVASILALRYGADRVYLDTSRQPLAPDRLRRSLRDPFAIYVGVDKFSTGWDSPMLSNIFSFRRTESPGLALQMVMRAGRTFYHETLRKLRSAFDDFSGTLPHVQAATTAQEDGLDALDGESNPAGPLRMRIQPPTRRPVGKWRMSSTDLQAIHWMSSQHVIQAAVNLGDRLTFESLPSYCDGKALPSLETVYSAFGTGELFVALFDNTRPIPLREHFDRLAEGAISSTAFQEMTNHRIPQAELSEFLMRRDPGGNGMFSNLGVIWSLGTSPESSWEARAVTATFRIPRWKAQARALGDSADGFRFALKLVEAARSHGTEVLRRIDTPEDLKRAIETLFRAEPDVQKSIQAKLRVRTARLSLCEMARILAIDPISAIDAFAELGGRPGLDYVLSSLGSRRWADKFDAKTARIRTYVDLVDQVRTSPRRLTTASDVHLTFLADELSSEGRSATPTPESLPAHADTSPSGPTASIARTL